MQITNASISSSSPIEAYGEGREKETIDKLVKVLMFRSLKEIDLHVKEVIKTGRFMKIGERDYTLHNLAGQLC